MPIVTITMAMTITTNNKRSNDANNIGIAIGIADAAAPPGSCGAPARRQKRRMACDPFANFCCEAEKRR